MPTKTLQILVVEAHDAQRESLIAALHAVGHAARGQADAHATVADISGNPTDIVLFAASGDDGPTLLRALRSIFPAIGILVLSPLSRSSDKAASYSNGADIYLVKPASDEEIAAAVTAIARRVRPHLPAGKHDGVPLDSPYVLLRHSLQLLGPHALTHVSDMEEQILSAFAQASGQRLELAQMLAISSKKGIEPSKGALEVQIVRLRKKLAFIGAPAPTIKSIRGSGYQLCVSLAVESATGAAAHLSSLHKF